MPIIYTYPKLQNPIGNELVVITDPNDKKFTKQITLSQIASLVPGSGGGGCNTAITSIIDTEGASLYTAPACSPMQMSSTDGSITISGGAAGIDLSANSVACTWNLQELPFSSKTPTSPYLIDCGETVFIESTCTIDGTITPSGNSVRLSFDLNYGPYGDEGGSDIIGCATSGTPDCESEILFRKFSGGDYEVQRATVSSLAACFSTSVECASILDIGGIRIASVAEGLEPGVDTDGTPYAVEVNDLCQGFVRVPSSGGKEYVLPCSTPTALGGVKTGKAGNMEVPIVPDEGTYYQVETIETEDPSDPQNCRAVVKVPSSGAVAGVSSFTNSNGTFISAATENNAATGAVSTGVIDLSATGTPSSTTFLRGDNTWAEPSSGPVTAQVGFSPMSIYEARNTIAPIQQTYFIQHVVNSDTAFNTVDLWSLNGGITGNLTIGVYSGQLNTSTVSNATLIAYGTAGAITVGVNQIALTTAASGNATVPAGQDVVIMISRDTEGPAILGIPGSQYPLNQTKLAIKTSGYLVSTGLNLGDTITDNLQLLFEQTGESEATGVQVDRFALHFYSLIKDDVVEEEIIDEEEEGPGDDNTGGNDNTGGDVVEEKG